jgi:hypothetical protein
MYDDLMKKKAKGIRGGIFTEDSGVPPPDEPDMGSSPPPKKKPKKMAKGGSASSRADGIAQRGKTRGMMC